MTDRRRNTMILLVVVGLLAASLAVIATKPTRLGLDLKGGVELVYQAKATAQSKVDTESLERAINIMRKRVDQIGVSQPEIQRSGKEEIDVALPNVHNIPQAEKAVGTTAQLNFYDWETNVIGPSGKTEPSAGTVTGDSTSEGAGGATAGLTQYQAVLRAAKRPAMLRGNDTTWTPGCTPEQKDSCIYGNWYLLDTAKEKVLARARRNRRQPVLRAAPERHRQVQAEGRAGQPGHRDRAGPPGRKRKRQSHEQEPQQLLRPQRQPASSKARTSPTRRRASTKAPAAPASRT